MLLGAGVRPGRVARELVLEAGGRLVLVCWRLIALLLLRRGHLLNCLLLCLVGGRSQRRPLTRLGDRRVCSGGWPRGDCVMLADTCEDGGGGVRLSRLRLLIRIGGVRRLLM
jgi:hypothetical protein